MNAVVNKFRQEVSESVNQLTQIIADGRMETLDQYRYNCGLRYGMLKALDIFNQIYSEANATQTELEE